MNTRFRLIFADEIILDRNRLAEFFNLIDTTLHHAFFGLYFHYDAAPCDVFALDWPSRSDLAL
jgi:hypothetical protein